MEEPYTKREIDSLHQVIIDKLNTIDSKANTIDEKVTKTNGRVKNLELWKSYLVGAISILSVITGAFLIPLLSKLLGL